MGENKKKKSLIQNNFRRTVYTGIEFKEILLNPGIF